MSVITKKFTEQEIRQIAFDACRQEWANSEVATGATPGFIVPVIGGVGILMTHPFTSFLWNPDNTGLIVALAGAAVGIATVTISGLKLWLEAKRNRSLKIRHLEFEIEIRGHHSEEEIEAAVKSFWKLKHEADLTQIEFEVEDQNQKKPAD